ncbi:MAG: chorismate synthase [Parasporobacterium sp.]|nr:chorismate synthase [Parasporobacterium sp.]
MKNTLGQSLTITLFGESHGPAIGAVLDGLAPGLPVDEAVIADFLSRRRPSDELSTARREPDHFQIVSGVFEGKTTGTPLCILIPNTDTKSADYSRNAARPSHADYAAFCKYHGAEDYRGGGHFSGRITAAIVAAGGILIPALENLGITLGTHIYICAGNADKALTSAEDIKALKDAAFPVLDKAFGQSVKENILAAKNNQDSIGGVTQTAVFGLPAGLGEPWFDSVESLLAHGLYSIGGIKGVEFGAGFGFADGTGSSLNDAFRNEGGKVITTSNNNGGINGGITNGMPVIFQCAVKPTPSVSRPQETIDLLTGENTEITIAGRHDPAIIRRICPVIDSMTAIIICDMLAARYGTDVLVKGF